MKPNMQVHSHVENSIPNNLHRSLLAKQLAYPHYLEEIAKTHNFQPKPKLNTSFTLRKKIIKANNLSHCTSGFISGVCKNGHQFAKAIFCNREYCTNCGENWSEAHQRRYYRWIPLVKSMDSVGYLVITLPPGVRKFFLDKKSLNEFRKYSIKLMQRQGFARGLSRWHWCGDCKKCKGESKEEKKACLSCKGTGAGAEWHPHLNFLFPAVWIPKEKIADIQKKMCAKVSRMTGQSLKTIVINYRYSNKVWKKKHWCKYVTRSTWRQFSDAIAQVVYRYRNNVAWGDWKEARQANAIAKLEKGCCPLCDASIKWAHFQPTMEIINYKAIKAGYFISDEIRPPP